MLFPETSFALNKKRLGVFGWEVEVLGAWGRSTYIFDEFLIPPERVSREKSESQNIKPRESKKVTIIKIIMIRTY